MSEGRFIVFEGLDGSGITTQVEFLRTWCEKRRLPVYVTKEPSDGPAGAVIKQVLRRRLVKLSPQALALLFAADREDHVATEIWPALSAGMIVICDRYYLSSFAYQSVDVSDFAWLRAINSKCPPPDITVYLDVPAEVCVRRLQTDVWRGSDQLQLYEEVDRLRQVRANFLEAIKKLQQDKHRIAIIDGNREIRVVHDDIVGQLEPLINPSGRTRRRTSPKTGSQQIASILESTVLTT